MTKSNFKSGVIAVAEFIWEMIKVAVTVIIIVYLVKTYVFQLFIVDGQSMEPNLHNSEMLLVEKLSYHFASPHRGDIIVFENPDDTSTNFIKRIIGLPGEKVSIHDSKVYIFNQTHPDGLMLDEKYLSLDTPTNGNQEYTVGSDQLFVLGDNRTNSHDSRVIGPISQKLVVGRAMFTYWPIKDAVWLFLPQYNT